MGLMTEIIFCGNIKWKIEQIDEWLESHDQPKLKCIPSEYISEDFRKNFFDDVYIGIYNYLPVDEFISFVKSLDWHSPASMLIKTHADDDNFTFMNLYEE